MSEDEKPQQNMNQKSPSVESLNKGLLRVEKLLGISEEEVKKLAEKGELPAYQIGGRFLRFRREQIEAIAGEIVAKPRRRKPTERASLDRTSADRILDFFYFNDFYIISAVLIFIILWVIIKH